MPFSRKYVLMDQAGNDGGAGGGGPTLEELQKQLKEATDSIQKLTEKNKELINEKASAKQKADEAQKAADEALKAKAAASGDSSKLLEIVQKELEEKNELIEQMSKAEETRKAEKDYAEKYEAFKEDTKAFKFKNEKHVQEIFKSRFAEKYVKNEDGSFNADGRKQAQKEFLKEYDYMVDTSSPDLTQEASRRASDQSELNKEIKEAFKL